MSIGERIRAAVTPVVAECVAELYRGEAEEYCVFNFTELPEGFGDNKPHMIRYLIQLHYCLPWGMNPNKTKRALRRAILDAGFTAPTITPNADELGQEFVFEFEGLDGDV